MTKYYIHKLTNYETNESKRGKLIYISKSQDVLQMFPKMSTTILNDTTLLSIYPLYMPPKLVYRPFVYNNGKHTGDTTRDEYRIYVNNELDPMKKVFNLDNIIVFVERYSDSREQENSYEYYLDCFSPTDINYIKLDGIINESRIGQHAIFEGTLDFIDNKIKSIEGSVGYEIEIGSDVIELAEQEISISPSSVPSTDYDRLFKTQKQFRDFVMVSYGDVCAVKGSSISFGRLNNIEAAHIIPKELGGSFFPSNGIAMSREMHWAYDNGFFKIDKIENDFIITVHPNSNGDELAQYDGKTLKINENNKFLPDEKFLSYHNEQIYGKFLQTLN